MDPVYHVLFLCTGNSARSLMAECALKRIGAGRFRAWSAGSHPKPEPHPLTLRLLRDLGYETGGLRSKSWDEFATPDGPPLDFVFTVCDNARDEACPVWPGQPVTAHWSSEDPAAATGSEEARLLVFRRVYVEIESRIRIFTQLPIAALDRLSLQARVEGIGKASPEPGKDG